jgi:glycosyltransferase involved in cell wall biosynthesis
MTQSKPIRLLFLVPERLPTYRTDVAVLFQKYLPTLGIRGTLVGQGSDTKTDRHNTGFILQTSEPGGGRLRREFNFFRTCLRHLLAAKPADIDVIQVRDMVMIGFIAAMIARARGMKFVYWMSFLMCEGRLQNASRAWSNGRKVHGALVWAKATLENFMLYRFLLPKADHVFVQSDMMVKYVAQRGIANRKMTAVPMGVDIDSSQATVQAGSPLQPSQGVPKIGYLGTLDAQRQLTVLIEALVEVRKHLPTAQLILVGDSPNPMDIAELRKAAARLGVADAIVFTGWLPIQAGWARMRETDVCVSPFPRGPILDTCSPTKLIEYMALGLPCIGNDNPDQQSVIEQSQAGWLVNGHSARGYANAILEVLRNQPAAAIRAAKGPSYIATHRSYRVIASQVATTYRQISIG